MRTEVISLHCVSVIFSLGIKSSTLLEAIALNSVKVLPSDRTLNISEVLTVMSNSLSKVQSFIGLQRLGQNLEFSKENSGFFCDSNQVGIIFRDSDLSKHIDYNLIVYFPEKYYIHCP